MGLSYLHVVVEDWCKPMWPLGCMADWNRTLLQISLAISPEWHSNIDTSPAKHMRIRILRQCILIELVINIHLVSSMRLSKRKPAEGIYRARSPKAHLQGLICNPARAPIQQGVPDP